MDIPKYLQIENELKKEIISGKFKYGDKFYSEAQLKEKFNVSSITVIRSVKDLVKAGYLVRHQGKGTFISRSRKDKLVRLSDNEVFSDKQEEDRVKVVKLQEDNQAKMLKKLGLPKYESYYYIERLRLIDDTPFMVHRSFIPAKFINKNLAKDYPVVRQVKKTILSSTGEVVELVVGYKRCDYFSLSFSSTDYPGV